MIIPNRRSRQFFPILEQLTHHMLELLIPPAATPNRSFKVHVIKFSEWSSKKEPPSETYELKPDSGDQNRLEMLKQDLKEYLDA